MKLNSFFTALLVLFSFTAIKAQINMDFETWSSSPYSANVPSGWTTFNFDGLGFPASTFEETADPGEGTSSVKMVTTAGYTALFGFDIVGGVASQSFPYTDKPTSIDFLYKVSMTAGDTGFFNVELWHRVGSQKVVDAVGSMIFEGGASVTTWSNASLLLSYFTSDKPDSMQIIMASSKAVPAPQAGSELYVDKISFVDSTSTGGQDTVLCDSLVVNCCSFGTTPTLTFEVTNNSSYSFPYCGFVLYGMGGDTAAVDDGANSFGMSPGLNNRSISATSNFSLPFTGYLKLFEGYHAGNIQYMCSFLVSISDTTNTVNLSVTAVGNASSTASSCDGTAVAAVTGGTSPYIYLWDDPNAQTNATAVGLCPGTYNVMVTDAGGATGTASAGVIVLSSVNDLNTDNGMLVYPNPAEDVLYVSLVEKNNDLAYVSLIDMTGKTVYSSRISENKLIINSKNWNPGVYVVQLISEGIVSRERVILK